MIILGFVLLSALEVFAFAGGACSGLFSGEQEVPSGRTETKLLGLSDPTSQIEINADAQFLSTPAFLELKKKKMVLGVSGFLKAGRHNEKTTREILTELLGELDPKKVILAGDIAAGEISLIMFEIAGRLGFETLGFYSYEVAGSRSARVDYFIVDVNLLGRKPLEFMYAIDAAVDLGRVLPFAPHFPVFRVVKTAVQKEKAALRGEELYLGKEAGQKLRSLLGDLREKSIAKQVSLLYQEIDTQWQGWKVPESEHLGIRVSSTKAWEKDSPERQDFLRLYGKRLASKRYGIVDAENAFEGPYLGLERHLFFQAKLREKIMGFSRLIPNFNFLAYKNIFPRIRKLWLNASVMELSAVFEDLETVDRLNSYNALIKNQIAFGRENGVDAVYSVVKTEWLKTFSKQGWIQVGEPFRAAAWGKDEWVPLLFDLRSLLQSGISGFVEKWKGQISGKQRALFQPEEWAEVSNEKLRKFLENIR